MDIEKFKTNIAEFRNDADWCRWMAVINGHTEKWAKNRLRKKELIHGYCEDFAVYFCYKYNLPLYNYDNKHFLLFVNGLYYDGYNNRGVDDIHKLQFVKEERWKFYATHTAEEQFYSGAVWIDQKWKTYNVYVNNSNLITKENNHA